MEAAKNLRSLIPEGKEDDQFKKDLEEAKIVTKKDIRPMVAGNIRLSEEKCKELGIKIFEDVEGFDAEKLKRACINQIDRLNLGLRTEERTIIP
jgi:hypothetical protein